MIRQRQYDKGEYYEEDEEEYHEYEEEYKYNEDEYSERMDMTRMILRGQ